MTKRFNLHLHSYFKLLLGRYGQLVGMMAVKIKVVRETDGSSITYGAAFIRTILLIIDVIPYYRSEGVIGAFALSLFSFD